MRTVSGHPPPSSFPLAVLVGEGSENFADNASVSVRSVLEKDSALQPLPFFSCEWRAGGPARPFLPVFGSTEETFYLNRRFG